MGRVTYLGVPYGMSRGSPHGLTTECSKTCPVVFIMGHGMVSVEGATPSVDITWESPWDIPWSHCLCHGVRHDIQ